MPRLVTYESAERRQLQRRLDLYDQEIAHISKEIERLEKAIAEKISEREKACITLCFRTVISLIFRTE